jgi:transposase
MELLSKVFKECSERAPERKFELYQDRAPCHVSKKTMGRIAELGISTVDPPGVSPDANPIENCWTSLSRLVYKKSSSFNTRDELKKAILESWEELDVATINSYCASIKRRLLAISDAKGSCTKY